MFQIPITDPPPMQDVARVRHLVQSAHDATMRATRAWNRSQLLDALRSAKDFIALAEANLP